MNATQHPLSQEMLMAFLDGESIGAEESVARKHLESCDECSKLARAMEQARTIVANWPVEDLPPASAEKIRANLLSDIRTRADLGKTGQWSTRTGKRFLLIGASAVSVGVLFFAIATPNLLRSRMAANEASAVGSLRTLNTAAGTYVERYGHYPISLENFGPPSGGAPSQTAADLVDAVLAGGKKSGYRFAYRHLRISVGGDGYQIDADPISPGESGKRHFFTDQTGVIRVNGEILGDSAEQRAGRPAAAAAAGDLGASGVMVAQTAELKVVVRKIDVARNSLDRIIEKHGGHIAQLSANAEGESGRILVASLRVPADKLGLCFADIKMLGRVTLESQTGEELRQQHTDHIARIDNARKTEARINDVIQHKTGNVKDVLEAEAESARVRGEIERMEAERKAMETRVTFATVAVTLTEEYQAQLNSPDAATRLRNAFILGVRDAWNSGVGLAVWVVSVLPSGLLWLLILFFPARWGWRRWRTSMSHI